MAFSLASWRARHLLGAWVAYWVSLGVVTLGPAFAAISRVTGPGDKGSVSLNGGDNGLVLTVAEASGNLIWSGAASIPSLAFWVTGPPLLLWLVWLAKRPSPARRDDASSGVASALPNADPARRAIGEGAAEPLTVKRPVTTSKRTRND